MLMFFIQVNYLKEFGLSTECVGKLLAFRPQLMGCSIEERWKPLVKYLYYLGISRDGMRRMLTIKPMVFCFNFETTIVPKVAVFFFLNWLCASVFFLNVSYLTSDIFHVSFFLFCLSSI